MNIREKIAQNPVLGTALGVALVLAAALLLCLELWNSRPMRLNTLYTDDDGKTWFKDGLRKLTPFDHDGKQAFRVQVYRCGGGPPFIGWMEEYGDDDRQRLETAAAQGDLALAANMTFYKPAVKRPGDTKWVGPGSAAQYEAMTTPKCSDGSQETPQLVGPDE
jgi:hypothetical protein